MPDPWVKIPLEKYTEINRATKKVLGTVDGDVGGSRGKYYPDVARYAKIISCAKATGYATAQFCTGDPGGTLVPDTSFTFKVFVGKNTFCRKDDFVVVKPTAAPSLSWEVDSMVTGFTLYRDPATDGSTLATTQDNPAVDSYCTDTVTVP